MAIRVIVKESGARLRVRGLTPPGPPVTELIAKATNNASWDNMGWYHNDIRAIFDPDTRAFIPYDSTKTYTLTDSSWNGASYYQSDAVWGQSIDGLSLVNNSGNLCVKNASGTYANRSGFKYTAEEKPTLKLYFKADKSDMTLPKTGWYALYDESGQPATTTESRYVYNCEIYSSNGVLMSSCGKAGAVNGSWTGGNDSGSIIFSASYILIPPA